MVSTTDFEKLLFLYKADGGYQCFARTMRAPLHLIIIDIV
jgi:hypothetical protein